MSEHPEKQMAVVVGVLGAGPLFNDVEERRRMREHGNRRGR
jgi:hypothetical protein